MTIFWILVVGLAGLALLFVLAPLLSSTAEADRDDDVDIDKVNLGLFERQLAELDADLSAGKLDRNQYDSARQDLEREVLNNLDTKNAQQRSGFSLPSKGLTALALVVVVPASTLALYLALGGQDMIPPMGAAGQVATAQGHNGAADGIPSLDALVIQLEERLQQTPDDAEGWITLGRTYLAMQDTEKAETALTRAYALMPKDSQVLLAYAEALAANNDNSLEGRPSVLIAEALELDPDDVTARWLSGMAAFQRGQFTAAAVAWKRVLGETDPESEDAAELRRLIDNAEQRAEVPSTARLAEKNGAEEVGPTGEARASNGDEEHPAESKPATQADAGAPVIEVDVSLAPALLSRTPPDTTVFVYAKAAAGPPMPLAVRRIRVADLPKTLRLDDSMAMMPSMKLSSFPRVIVGARVSTSGQAMPQSGDLEGETGPISSSGSTQVAVSIDRARP